MYVTKFINSGRFIRKDLLYRVVPKKFNSNDVTKEENLTTQEKGKSEAKPITQVPTSAQRVPKRLYSSDVPICASGKDKQGSDKDKASSEITSADGTKKGLVVGVYEAGDKFELTDAAQEINQKSGGKLCQHLSQLSSELKQGKAFVLTDVLKDYYAVAITSLGPRDPGFDELEQLDKTRENIRCGVGAAVLKLQNRGCAHISVDGAGAPDAAAEAAELAAWRFQEYKSCGDRVPESAVSLYGASGAELWHSGSVRGRAQNWARYLSDMPSNNMTPVDLAQAALDELCPLGVKVEAHERSWMEAQRMRAVLAVARGSCEAPYFLQCAYNGAKDTQAPVLIVAKGITFDSGGLCLKSPSAMENRGSMAGAAVTLAALKIIATLKVPINVVACIPLCENMVSGQCMKVGDVVQALNGLSIQIEDTDMEGRLVLADALVYGQALHRPALVLDVATLTRGVSLATGGGAFGAFSNNDAAWRTLQRAGALSGDRPWRFPLWHYYSRHITDDPAVDLRNKGSSRGTPCVGAAFLRHFVCGDWVHLDITGVDASRHGSAPYLRARRTTGRPTRTLALMLQNVAQSCSDKADGAQAKDAK